MGAAVVELAVGADSEQAPSAKVIKIARMGLSVFGIFIVALCKIDEKSKLVQ